jgi:hypothetical protein
MHVLCAIVYIVYIDLSLRFAAITVPFVPVPVSVPRMGCRWCASTMTRSNASKSDCLRNICILPTDRFRT